MKTNGRPAFFILLLFTAQLLGAQLGNPGFKGAAGVKDSLFWQPNYLILGAPDSSSFSIEITAPSSFKNKPAYYDSRVAIPKNRLFLDTRSSSYYVPRQVGDKLTHIMNRPSSNEVAPVFTAAVLAASIAIQYMNSGHMPERTATDYLVNENFFPILKALWQRAPQTAFQLYENAAIKNGRTVVILQKELSALTDLNILKIKTQEKAPSLYFPAEKKEKVKQLLSESLHNESFTSGNKQKFRMLIHIIDSLR